MRLPRKRAWGAGVAVAIAASIAAYSFAHTDGPQEEAIRRLAAGMQEQADAHAREEREALDLAERERHHLVLAMFDNGGGRFCREVRATGSEAREGRLRAVARRHARLASAYRRAASNPSSREAWSAICREHIAYHQQERDEARASERARLPEQERRESTLADLERRRLAGTFACDEGFMEEWRRLVREGRAATRAAEYHAAMIEKYERAEGRPWEPIAADPAEPEWRRVALVVDRHA